MAGRPENRPLDLNVGHEGTSATSRLDLTLQYNAIVSAGIEVVERHELPLDQIPADARVEIDAKIAAGYYSSRAVTGEALESIKGRSWEDVDH